MHLKADDSLLNSMIWLVCILKWRMIEVYECSWYFMTADDSLLHSTICLHFEIEDVLKCWSWSLINIAKLKFVQDMLNVFLGYGLRSKGGGGSMSLNVSISSLTSLLRASTSSSLLWSAHLIRSNSAVTLIMIRAMVAIVIVIFVTVTSSPWSSSSSHLCHLPACGVGVRVRRDQLPLQTIQVLLLLHRCLCSKYSPQALQEAGPSLVCLALHALSHLLEHLDDVDHLLGLAKQLL